jgi:hypothetical protein
MSKILILAQSGFGKTTSIAKIPELGHIGLDPNETYIISVTSKPLPFGASGGVYKIVTPDNFNEGRRVVTSNGVVVSQIIKLISDPKSPIKNIVLDDSNYLMQDYYMARAVAGGYDVFKEIGKMMHGIFAAAENLRADQNFIMMAHYEEYRDSSSDTISYRYKTVGKMVQDYITPEGKFDIVLFGKQTINESEKKIEKKFVTNYDGQFPAKSPIGMFKETYIPNDLGLVVKTINEFYNQ